MVMVTRAENPFPHLRRTAAHNKRTGLSVHGYMEVLKTILTLLGGLGVFLIALKIMSENLESVAGSRLRSVFNRISSNRFAGIAVGTGVTMVIQSSSATTVMVVGFVNAGVMTLSQAASIIMGANIGTTITAQIGALQSLPITAFFAALACVGAFMQMSKHDKVNLWGCIIGSIGMIFVGLQVMSSAMKTFSNSPVIEDVMTSISNPVLLLLIGLTITAIVQSSSATTIILITMAGANLMTLENAIFITLGINIGTCVTAMFASIGATPNGKRASFIHLTFNCIGSVIFFILALVLPIDKWLQAAFPEIETQIAMFHTIFNVTTTILLVPFIKQLTQLACLVIRDKKPAPNEDGFVEEKFQYVDERLLATPTIALAQVRKEILLMASIAKKNFDTSVYAITIGSLAKQPKFEAREKHLNFLNKELTNYLVKVSSAPISKQTERELSSYYHVISDLERVGDYSENIMEYTEKLVKNNVSFSEAAKGELAEMKSAIDKLYDVVMTGYINKDISQKDEMEQLEESVDEYKVALDRAHIARLSENLCSPDAGAVWLNLINDMERIGDHFRNVYTSMDYYVEPPTKVKATVNAKAQ